MKPSFSDNQKTSIPNHQNGVVSEERRLFFQHLALVGYVVKKVVGSHNPPQPLEQADFIQWGMIGLLDAAERFDPARGVHFPTYAVSRIRGTIQDELRKLDWIPRSVRKQDRDRDMINQKLEIFENTRVPSENILQRLAITIEEYHALLEHAKVIVSDHVIASEVMNDVTEMLVIDEENNPYERIEKTQLWDEVFHSIDKLEPRDRMILILYYYEELTFKEIARILHVSESRVFQIYSAVMENLREKLKGFR